MVGRIHHATVTNVLEYDDMRASIRTSSRAHEQDTRAMGLEGPHQEGVATDFTGQNFYYG